MQKNAVLFGLSLDDFLYGNPLLFSLYRDVFIQKMNIQIKQDDNKAYLIGAYSLRAFRQVMKEIGFAKGYPKNLLFPDKSFSEQQEEQKNIDKNMALKVDAYMRTFCK